MLAAALLAWAVITPGMRGPDEPNHVAVAVDLFETGAYPPPGTAPFPASVRASYPWFGFPGAAEVFSSAGPVGALPDDAPTLRDLRDENPTADAAMTNQITQHPPLYYLALAGAIHAFGLADVPVTQAILALRLVTAAMLLPIPALIATTCRRLRLPPAAILAASFIPAAWIQFAHINVLVGNGALLALTCTLALALMVRVVTGDLTVRTGVALGFALAAALWTKGYALALLPLAIFVYLWRWRADRARIWPPMLAGAAVAALGLVWYVGALLVHGSLQPTAGPPKVIVFAWEPLLTWIGVFARDLSGSMWMNLGWLETPIRPAALHIAASLIALALAAYGAWRLRDRPAVIVLLVGAILLTVLIFAVGSARHWLWNGTIRAAQGRYLHGAVLAVAVMIAAGLPRARWIAVAAPSAAALSVLAGAVFGVRHFWEDASLSYVVAAWPAGGIVLVLAVMLLIGGIIVGTVAASRLPPSGSRSRTVDDIARDGAATARSG